MSSVACKLTGLLKRLPGGETIRKTTRCVSARKPFTAGSIVTPIKAAVLHPPGLAPQEMLGSTALGDWSWADSRSHRHYPATRRGRFERTLWRPGRRYRGFHPSVSAYPQAFRKTLTVDNGKEFAGFKDIEEKTGLTVYFADPYAAWQRGCNENTNGLLGILSKGMQPKCGIRC